MKPVRLFIVSSALLASGLGALVFFSSDDAKAAPTLPASASATPSVSLTRAKSVRSTQREEVTGSLFPAKGLQMGFELGGRLDKIRVSKGQAVSAGQVLGQLDSEIANAQVAQAQAAVEAAQAGATLASDVAERNEKLKAHGNVSDLASKNASASSQQAQAQLLSAQAALAQAQAARKRHDLKAPFSGTVIDAPEQVGAIVGPGTPLFAVEQLDTLLLKTTVAESARGRLKVGAHVRVESLSGGASTDLATVRNVLPSADPTTRRVPVDILVPNKDGRFLAHTLARAVLSLGESEEAKSIPTTALSSSGGDHVYVVDGSQALRRVAVVVIERTPKEVVVRASQPLDQIVDHPAQGFSDGTRVVVK